MKNETPCPVCRRPVTMGMIMSASTPSRIKCKNCKSRLKAGEGATPALVSIFVFVSIVGFLLGFVLTILVLDGQIALVEAMVFILVVVIPTIIAVELIFSMVVCNKSGLVPYGRQW